MATHVWSLLCRQPIVDAFTHTLTIVDVLEEIQIAIVRAGNASKTDLLPVPTFDFVLVSLWIRSDDSIEEDARLRARIIAPSGKIIGTTEQAYSLKEHQRARNLLHARGVPAPESGRYTIEVQVPVSGGRWRTVSRLPLDVKLTITVAASGGSASAHH
jgi:hypothetical protein